MQRYKGKNIWIIGASSGIGAALARRLSAEGAVLTLSARSAEALEALNNELGGHHLVCSLDVKNEEEIKAALNAISGKFTKLDSVIFLPALYRPMSFTQMDMGFVKEALDINIMAAFYTVNAALPYMLKQGYGQIALCGSVAGYKGLPNGQPYSATKAAIANMAETLKIEMRQHNIDAKLISPGFVRTTLTDKNNFKMPMMIEPEDAARHIADGLLRKKFEIRFPPLFGFIMGALRQLPYCIYFSIFNKK